MPVQMSHDASCKTLINNVQSNFRRNKAGNWAQELAALLNILHEQGQVHRDLKPGNVLLMLQSQVWRLIDFGIVAEAGVPSAAVQSLAGTQGSFSDADQGAGG